MKPTSDNKKRRALPANIPPTIHRRGICVQVPDDVEYIAQFMGNLYELTKQSRYDRDPLHKAKDVAEIWRQVYNAANDALHSLDDCAPFPIPEEGCTDYLPSNPRIQYAPNDPFQTPNLRPTGYALPPFYTNPLVPLPGVIPTDAMVNLLAIPSSMTLPDLIEIGFPRIHIPVSGIGEVEVELVKVPQGGIAVIFSDDDFGTTQVIDLNSVGILGIPALEDVLGVVLEDSIHETEIVEFDFEEPGEHYIDIWFFPNISSTVILGFGGGLRRVSVCAGAAMGDVPVPEFRITDCDLEWRPNNLASWSNLGNVCGADGTNGTNGTNGAAGSDAQLPVGAIIPFGGTTEPTGWLFAHGQAISRTTYAELFAVIGTGFGAGNGSTTFNVPDMRQNVPRGIGTSPDSGVTTVTMGQTPGADAVVIDITNIPAHTHTVDIRKSASAFGTQNRAAAPSTAAGTETTIDTGSAGGTGGGGQSNLDILPRVIGTEYIICYQSVNNTLNVEFQIDGCDLQWRKNGGSWTTLVDLTECATPGQTPEFRMTAIDADTQAIEWKYTDEPDLPGAWRTAGYVDDGTDGIAEQRPVSWRLIAETYTRRVLQWRYTDEVEVPSSWRTVGAWDIPTSEGCDCDETPAPGDVIDADRCKVSWGLTNRLTAEIAALIDYTQEKFVSFPLGIGLREGETLSIIRQLGIFLSRFIPVGDWWETFIYSITDDTDALDFRTALLDTDTRQAIAEAFYSIYDPNFVITDQHIAIIASTLLIAHPAEREFLAVIGWMQAINIERIRDMAISAAVNDEDADCTGFTIPDALTGASFNFVTNPMSVFEDDSTLIIPVRLSLNSGTLGTETRVYYEAIDITAQNGADYNLPAGYITFPASATNGTVRTITLPVIDNDLQDGNRTLGINLVNVVGRGIIGNVPTTLITIKDNEDFYLVINGNGTNLELIEPYKWRADATGSGSNWRLWLDSMNLDANRCFKVVSITYGGTTPSGKSCFLCGSGGETPRLPLPDEEIHALRFSNSVPFSVTVEILPA